MRGLDEYYPLGTPVSFYLIVWRRPETGDRFEKENGRGFFLPCLSQPVRRVRYITATQVGYFQQAQHTRVAQFVSPEVTDSTYAG